MGIGNDSCFELCACNSDPESGKGVIATFIVGYWASSEISERWAGFFEGALLTGEAAAKAILAKLEDN